MIKLATQIAWNVDKLAKRVDKQTRRWLFQKAGMLRTIARRQMKRQPGPSKPGEPPAKHAKGGGLQPAFAVDLPRREAVIGFHNINSEAAEAIEKGGKVWIWERRWDRRKKKHVRTGRRMQVTIKARPGMAIALTKMKSKLPDGWAGSV